MTTRPAGRSRLGRGLGSLISSATAQTDAADNGFFLCPIELIDPMSGQPRRHFNLEKLRELAGSIAESGVIQPLVVREAEGGRYTIVAGERRLRAAKMARLTEIPVVVREIADEEAFALALVENIQREDLNPIEEALAFHRLTEEFGYTQDEVARQVGKSRSAVANSVRLLKLNRIVQDLVADGMVSAGHARAVLSVPDDHQAALAERIVTEGLSVRQAEELARAFRDAAERETDPTPPPSPTRAGLTPQLKQVQRQLMEHFGARVVIQRKTSGAGSIELHFADDAGLQALLDTVFED